LRNLYVRGVSMPTRMEMLDALLAARCSHTPVARARAFIARTNTEIHEHPLQMLAAGTAAAFCAGWLAGFATMGRTTVLFRPHKEQG